MKLQRVFLTTPMNPAHGSDGPSGIEGGAVHPASHHGTPTTFRLPPLRPDQVVMVTCPGNCDAILAYDPATPDGLDVPAEFHTGQLAGRVRIEGGKHTILTDTGGDIVVTYHGGPIYVLPGSFHYAIIDDDMDPNHADARVRI